MALIKCEKCQNYISEYAEKCIYCSEKIDNEDSTECPECGIKIKEDMAHCFNCGYPLQMKKTKKKNFKKIFIIFLSILISIYIAFTALNHFDNKQNQYVEYYQSFNQATEEIDKNGPVVYECYSLLISVWNNAIWQKKDVKTDQYVMPNGEFVIDFNEALDNLYSDETFSEKIASIIEMQRKLRVLREKLNNPPIEEREKNETLLALIDKEIEISMLIINPSGTYNDVSKEFNELFIEMEELYEKLVSLLSLDKQ